MYIYTGIYLAIFSHKYVASIWIILKFVSNTKFLQLLGSFIFICVHKLVRCLQFNL